MVGAVQKAAKTHLFLLGLLRTDVTGAEILEHLFSCRLPEIWTASGQL
jgi:hypothetical protein